MSFINKSTLTEDFSTLPNEISRRKDLSFKAKGVLWYLLSRPSDWKVYIKEIAEHGKEGVAAVRSAIKELTDLGYVVRTTERENGVITDWVYFVYDKPVTNPDNPPHHENLEVENLEVENRTLLNIDSTKKEYTNIYPEFIGSFNRIVGSNHRPTVKVKRKFNARLNDGYTLNEMVEAVKKAKANDFLMGKNENKKRYLTPEYILREDKLDEWLNATSTKEGKRKTIN